MLGRVPGTGSWHSEHRRDQYAIGGHHIAEGNSESPGLCLLSASLWASDSARGICLSSIYVQCLLMAPEHCPPPQRVADPRTRSIFAFEEGKQTQVAKHKLQNKTGPRQGHSPGPWNSGWRISF